MMIEAPGEGACSNCGHRVEDRFCATCGQDSERRIESVPGFVRRLAKEASDLEGPFWRTFRLIFLRPGALTREYSEGRFASQVSPVRLYLIVAALLFFLFPAWSRWASLDSGSSGVTFPSALALAVTVPVWAAVIWTALVGRRTHFEVAFVFSAHFHVAFLVGFFALSAFVPVLTTLGVPVRVSGFLMVAFLFVLMPLYLFFALRKAYGLGWIRAGLTAAALGWAWFYVGGAVTSLLARLGFDPFA